MKIFIVLFVCIAATQVAAQDTAATDPAPPADSPPSDPAQPADPPPTDTNAPPADPTDKAVDDATAAFDKAKDTANDPKVNERIDKLKDEYVEIIKGFRPPGSSGGVVPPASSG